MSKPWCNVKTLIEDVIVFDSPLDQAPILDQFETIFLSSNVLNE